MAELRGCLFPDELSYHPESHLWFADEGAGVLRVGVTSFGVAIAGEILLFTAKRSGLQLAAGRAFGLLEAGKTVFPVKTPLAGTLVESNGELRDSARSMNDDPYSSWLIRLAVDSTAEIATLLMPWAKARGAIEQQMHLWRFEDHAAFKPPLVGEGAKGVIRP